MDIVACTAPSLGNASACSGLSTHPSGSSLGLTNTSENVDAFACQSGTCKRFFTGAAHSLLRLADIETGTLLP